MELNTTKYTMKILVRPGPPCAARCDTFSCVKVEVETVPRRNVGPSVSDQKTFWERKCSCFNTATYFL